MWTGEYCDRETRSTEWDYFNEGNAHMIFFNKNQDPSNTYQDRVLVGEKENTGCYLPENVKINDLFNRIYNKRVLRHPDFTKFITQQKYCKIEEGETRVEFLAAMQKIADPIRADNRKHAHLGPNSPFWLEKNLFYISPMMKKNLEEQDALIFFAEIKPKCCFDEVPSFEEIKSHLDGLPGGDAVDATMFYDKLFKNCPPSERKFVYRKLCGAKHQILKEFNTADFYSKISFIRTKAIKALIHENWGNYLKILDGNMQIVPHDKIMDFFRAWDSQITVKTVAELIGRSLDFELITLVKGLQQSFEFYADELISVQKVLEESKQDISEEDLDKVMTLLADKWKAGNYGLDIEQVKAECGEKLVPLAKITAFLMSLTSRDSSFLLRSAISRKSTDFSVIEEWEQGKVHTFEDELHVEFFNATPVAKNNTENDGDKNVQFLADMLENKFSKGYSKQCNKCGDNDKECQKRSYYIKSRTNLCDVGVKPWNKLHEVVENNHTVNKNFVEFFLQPEQQKIWNN